MIRWIALLAGAGWVASTAILHVRITLLGDPFQSQAALDALRWVRAAERIGYALFLVAAGSYVILWLRSREASRARRHS